MNIELAISRLSQLAAYNLSMARNTDGQVSQDHRDDAKAIETLIEAYQELVT